MSNWASGYVTELDYTHGYYRELSPTLLAYAALHACLAAPRPEGARYLELGFGQGLSLNIHAAACPGTYWGTDFNPAHAANARELAILSGASLTALELSFAQLAELEDLPEFDYITLHGIWSWISDENRVHLVDLVRRRLAPGGILFTSYNCTPGWSPSVPLRHLLTLHSQFDGSGPLTERVQDSVAFAQRVVDTGVGYFKDHPDLTRRLEKMKSLNVHYLAHEYFNADWHPMPFSRAAELWSGAKVTYATSAALLDHVDTINLSAECNALLAEIGHPVLRQSVRDYLINAQFRKDIFIKGARPISQAEQRQRLLDTSFVLLTHPEDVSLQISGPAGGLALKADYYEPVLAAMAERDYTPKSVRELHAHPGLTAMSLPQLVQALTILTGSGSLHPVQSAESRERARPACARLNRRLFELARGSELRTCAASPVTGGGVEVGRIQQMFVLALQEGRQAPQGWADFAWESLEEHNHKLLRDGQLIDSEEENRAELLRQAETFAERKLPLLRALAVVD